jgi:hypothetical protein
MAAAISEALGLRPAERAGLAARARGHAARFSLEEMTSATNNLYEGLRVTGLQHRRAGQAVKFRTG